MAIDTAQKRASSLSFGGTFGYVVPSGAISLGDRQTINRMYSGILADTEAPYVSEDAGWRLGLRHASFNGMHGGAMRAYSEDIIAGCLANEPTISATTVMGILREWLELKGYTQETTSGKMNAFATERGHHNWTSMGTFTAP
tara:strand:+ start:467 stop:892 length:426 start_codon:yes stop_codon:yes gene_type:complete